MYSAALEQEFITQYGSATPPFKGFERLYAPSSNAYLAAVANGTADTTEPYAVLVRL
jgi:hypothetical protein